jgi:small subunit ribosomal protein S20
MAITSSAKKAHRASKTKRVYNIAHRDAVSDAIKKFKTLVNAGKKTDAMAALKVVYSELDKAAKTNFIKKNTASRKKSRLSALAKKVK